MTLYEAILVGRGGKLTWRLTGLPVTGASLVDWFDVAFPEHWWVKQRRLKEAAAEAASFRSRQGSGPQ